MIGTIFQLFYTSHQMSPVVLNSYLIGYRNKYIRTDSLTLHVGNTLQLDHRPEPTATPGNSPSILSFWNFHDWKNHLSYKTLFTPILHETDHLYFVLTVGEQWVVCIVMRYNATVKAVPRRCEYIFSVAMLLCHSIFVNILLSDIIFVFYKLLL